MGKLFGTDGIRGRANLHPMTPDIAMALGKAMAVQFSRSRNGHNPRFLVGKDTRLSGYMFENALTAGLLSQGADVILVGPMPTPAIAHLTKSMDACAGLVISASHNPAEDNGIKIFSPDGVKLPDAVEEKLEAYILGEASLGEPITGDRIGRAKRIEDARGRYIEYVKNAIGSKSLEGLKIVLDCANGAAYIVAPLIFQELGAHVIVINDEPNGLNINKDCGALHTESLAKRVLQEKADVGIAVDGDADRLILVDETGEVLDGDYVLAIAGIDMLERGVLAKNTVVATGYSNLGLDEALKKKGGKIVRAQNGDRYVIEEMLKKGYNLGGEQSGHIIFGEHSATGDGTLAALKVIEIMKRKGKKLSQLKSVMKKYPQIIMNIQVKEKRDIEKLPKLKKAIAEVDKALGNEGRTLVRFSGTEKLLRVMVEGKDEKKIKGFAESIANAARETLC